MSTLPSTMHPKTLKLSPALLAWLAFISLCLIVGIVAGLNVFIQGLSITSMSDLVPWGLWITIDLSAIALGAGAFTLSAVVYIFGLKHFHSIVRLAVLVGFVGYTSALLTLVMDIGRPDRFWHPWAFWNVHSVLWEITWCITIYLVIMLLEFAPVIADSPLLNRFRYIHYIRRVTHLLHKLAPVLAVLGLGISLLHQSSLGATYGIVKSRPIWFKPSMPIMFILSAIAAGPALTMGIAIVLEWLTGKKSVPRDVLRTIARFSGLAFLAYGYIKFWDLASVAYYGRTPAVSEALFILNQQTPYNLSFWVGEVVLGILIPAILFLTPRFNQSSGLLVLGSLSGMIGIVIHRWNITVSGLFVPVAYSPGTQYHLPAGFYWPALVEWGVAVGILGYGLLVLTLGAKLLPLFDGDHHGG